MKHMIFSEVKKIKTKFSYVCSTVAMMLLAGCGQVNTSSDLYQNIQQQTQQFTADVDERKKYSVAHLTEGAYEFCNACKQYAPIVIVASIFIGILILHIVSEDQTIRRKAIMIFFIGIPVIMLALTFGLSWLVGAFL